MISKKNISLLMLWYKMNILLAIFCSSYLCRMKDIFILVAYFWLLDFFLFQYSLSFSKNLLQKIIKYYHDIYLFLSLVRNFFKIKIFFLLNYNFVINDIFIIKFILFQIIIYQLFFFFYFNCFSLIILLIF